MLLSRQAQRIMAARVQTRCTALPHMRMRLHSHGKYWMWRLQQQVGRPLLARLGSAGALYSMLAACGKAGLCNSACAACLQPVTWLGWAGVTASYQQPKLRSWHEPVEEITHGT